MASVSNFPILWVLAPEIEQGLTDAARSKVTVSFTPHLIPMVRMDLGVLTYIFFSCLSGN